MDLQFFITIIIVLFAGIYVVRKVCIQFIKSDLKVQCKECDSNKIQKKNDTTNNIV